MLHKVFPVTALFLISFCSITLLVILYSINVTKYLGWTVGNWWYLTAIHGVTKSWTQLSDWTELNWRPKKWQIFLWSSLMKGRYILCIHGFNILTFSFIELHVILNFLLFLEKANWDKFSKIGHVKVIGNQQEFLLRQIFCWFTIQVVIRWRLLHMKHASEWDRSLFPLWTEKVHWCEYSP